MEGVRHAFEWKGPDMSEETPEVGNNEMGHITETQRIFELILIFTLVPVQPSIPDPYLLFYIAFI